MNRLLVGFTLASCAAACGTSAGGSHDPQGTGPWSAGPALPVARFEGYGAVTNGRVAFLGGITGVLGDINTAQPSRRIDLLDPQLGTWTSGPQLPQDAPKHHLAVAVADEVVYVLGGFDGILNQQPNEPFLPIPVAYALTNGSWKKLATPPLARGAATAQAIDGKIYVTGGAPTENVPPYSELDIYDIATNSWSMGPSMPTAREHLASCAIGGKMIVVGGWVQDKVQNAAEEYDPATKTWTTLPPLPTARGGLAAAAYADECHVVGGEDWSLPMPGTFGVHEVWNATTRTWSTAPPMPTPRHGLGLAWLGSALYAIGGGPSQGNSYTATVEVFTR